jgi:predicted Zn-dependent peptidase
MLNSRYIDSKTSYSQDVVGSEKNLKGFKLEDVKDHFNKYYIPENIEVYMVGNFKLSTAKALLEKYFGTFKSKSKLLPREFIKNYPDYSSVKIKARQYYLLVNFPSPEFTLTSYEERILLPFLTSITASSQYQSSILWKRLREELGIVYDVSAGQYSMMSRSIFAVDTSFNPEYLETVLKEIYNGINLIKAGSEGESTFNARKKRFIDTELVRYDNPNNVLDWIINQEEEQSFHGRSFSIEQHMDLVKNIRFDEVIKIANKVYNWDKANIILVTKDDAKVVEDKVSKIWKDLVKS